jgi:hypothetical protein
MSRLGLTGWPVGEATRAAAICFTTWLDQRGTLGDHDIEGGIQQVIAYIEQFGGSRFEDRSLFGGFKCRPYGVKSILVVVVVVVVVFAIIPFTKQNIDQHVKGSSHAL